MRTGSWHVPATERSAYGYSRFGVRSDEVIMQEIVSDAFSQGQYRCRLKWGWRGTREAAAAGDILVIVDTLRFSTMVATAVEHGAIIYPCGQDDDPADLARRVGAEMAV